MFNQILLIIIIIIVIIYIGRLKPEGSLNISLNKYIIIIIIRLN